MKGTVLHLWKFLKYLIISIEAIKIYKKNVKIYYVIIM